MLDILNLQTTFGPLLGDYLAVEVPKLKMTGETPEVRCYKRKQREKREKTEKREKKREKEGKKREIERKREKKRELDNSKLGTTQQ